MSQSLLEKLILSLSKVLPCYYVRVTFATMCILAFHGFLRIGEICVKTNTLAQSVIQFEDVRLVKQRGDVIGVEIYLRKFKHSQNAVTLLLPKQQSDYLCPVTTTELYLSLVKHGQGPFFQLLDGSPITYSFFSKHLNTVVSFLGLNPVQYTSHSFRIGAATHAASKGLSDDEIKRLGRWKSKAFQNYIRMPVLTYGH